MNSSHPLYRGHHFPAEIISHCVWLYFRLSLSSRDAEGIIWKFRFNPRGIFER